jgi:hypothetical protein
MATAASACAWLTSSRKTPGNIAVRCTISMEMQSLEASSLSEVCFGSSRQSPCSYNHILGKCKPGYIHMRAFCCNVTARFRLACYGVQVCTTGRTFGRAGCTFVIHQTFAAICQNVSCLQAARVALIFIHYILSI